MAKSADPSESEQSWLRTNSRRTCSNLAKSCQHHALAMVSNVGSNHGAQEDNASQCVIYALIINVCLAYLRLKFLRHACNATTCCCRSNSGKSNHNGSNSLANDSINTMANSFMRPLGCLRSAGLGLLNFDHIGTAFQLARAFLRQGARGNN